MAHFLAPTGIVITIDDDRVERREDRLGIPALHMWALPEEGDDEFALDRALGEALGDLWQLLLAAHEDPLVLTEYERTLCRSFCQLAEVTIDWNDLPDKMKAILRRWPAGKMAEHRTIKHALSPIMISGKLMRALTDPVEAGFLTGALGAHGTFGGAVEADVELEIEPPPLTLVEEEDEKEED